METRSGRFKYDYAPIVEDAKKGMRPKDIEKKYGIAPTGVYRILKRCDVKFERMHGGRPKIDREEVRRLRDIGMTNSEIAGAIGCNYHTVCHILSELY